MEVTSQVDQPIRALKRGTECRPCGIGQWPSSAYSYFPARPQRIRSIFGSKLRSKEHRAGADRSSMKNMLKSTSTGGYRTSSLESLPLRAYYLPDLETAQLRKKQILLWHGMPAVGRDHKDRRRQTRPMYGNHATLHCWPRLCDQISGTKEPGCTSSTKGSHLSGGRRHSGESYTD